jgi:hypothetical protein
MRRPSLFVIGVLMSSFLGAQDWPAGVAGRSGRRQLPSRTLSQAVASSQVPVNFTGCGTARIDGILDPAEWSGATWRAITLNYPSGPIVGGLAVMNDNLNLYIGLRFPETVPLYGSLGVEFDNDNDGVPFEQGDDAFVANNQAGFFDDFRTLLPPCPPGAVCGPEDVDHGGTSDGQMRFANNGTESVYEISHPLDSGDAGHDFALSAGQTVGFFVHLRFIDASGGIFDTHDPGHAIYNTITVQGCLPPILSGCGTPTLDGLVKAGEWAPAGSFRFSVRTPHRGTAPATLYVMNDSFNLYMAVAYDRTIIASPGGEFLFFSFDDDHSGFASPGDDLISGRPAGTFYDMVAQPCGSVLCADSDTTHGGTIDGASAFANDGVRSAYELSHPLNSGDANDFALASGSSIPAILTINIVDPPGVFPADYAQSSFPVPFSWMTFAICTPSPGGAVGDLTARVELLGSGGQLDSKDADGLQKNLRKADDFLQRAMPKQAARELGNFSGDVTKLMRKGALEARYGQPLIEVADVIIRQLEK